MSRPLIAIPARFSQSASALRYRAVVTARALSEAVLRAGGEPLTVHPWAPSGQAEPADVAERLGFADGVLLPGGGDLAPSRYGAEVAHGEVYDVDGEQDGFDLAVAAWALSAGVPTLAICRGTQVVNVARGGTLEQHMQDPHRDVLLPVAVNDPALAAVLGTAPGGEGVEVSCYHHQRLERLGAGLAVAATAGDGTVEAVTAGALPGWFLGVQWHPEDTAATDPAQAALFDTLVAQAIRYRTVGSSR
ncbi:MAG: gamma-glutamyl-gamma-aminobutyrate hydrolase family protein [Kineosporiaceae bacterium]